MQNTLKQGYNEQYDITFNIGGELDVGIPSDKRVLLLDGSYNAILNSDCGVIIDGELYLPDVSLEDFVNYGIAGKINSIEKIFPRIMSPEESQLHNEVEQVWSNYRDMSQNELLKKLQEYDSKLSKYRTNNAVWRKVVFHKDNEMSMDCFQAILDGSGNPNYIIVTNDFVYEHLPSVGKPKDVDTSEGIVEAWEINGITMFYMPLTGNMSEEDILLWRTVLTEVLV